MKIECIKLEAYKGEQVMLIAPADIMDKFIVHLEVMAMFARDGQYAEGLRHNAEDCESFRKQLHQRREEIYEVHD